MPVNIPKVSVIMPVYNVILYLHECLNSLICQILLYFEFICMNDGSTNNSLDILNKYAKDTRFFIISQEKKTKYLSEHRKLLSEKEYKNLAIRIRTYNRPLTEQIFLFKNMYENAKKFSIVTLLAREFFIEQKKCGEVL